MSAEKWYKITVYFTHHEIDDLTIIGEMDMNPEWTFSAIVHDLLSCSLTIMNVEAPTDDGMYIYICKCMAWVNEFHAVTSHTHSNQHLDDAWYGKEISKM